MKEDILRWNKPNAALTFTAKCPNKHCNSMGRSSADLLIRHLLLSSALSGDKHSIFLVPTILIVLT